ncbi:MAG: glycosyltransferase [Candidatus Helarchaeota archaeon]
MSNEVSVLITAHNEEKVIKNCIKSILNQEGIKEIILVADRCTDKTIEIANQYDIKILEKNFQKSFYPWGEAINFGIKKITGNYTFICDADIFLTQKFMKNILKSVKTPKVAIVSGVCITKGLFGIPYYQTYLGGCKLIKTNLLKELKCEDLIAWDTFQDLTIEQKGYSIVVNKNAIAYEMRSFNFRNYLKKGILRGFARYQLDQPLPFILLHVILKFIRNPFTFPELIALLLGNLEARLIKSPIYKNLRKIMIQRQLKRIRNILFSKQD